MANSEESNPLLPNQELESGGKDEKKSSTAKNGGPQPHAAVPMGWTADGLPVGELMMEKSQWDSGIFSCLGRNDEFCSSDLEVCLLGAAPCVLYGTNVERLGSAPGTFANHCLPYTGFYLMGNAFFGWNCFAPLFSFPTRTAIRRKFNLEATNLGSILRALLVRGKILEEKVLSTFHINSLLELEWKLENKEEAVRHLLDHVGAAEAFWRMRFGVSNGKRHVILLPMSSAMHVLFVRKVVKFVVGFLILAS
ncbi:UNVERIFIED_CONTAM: Cell number regulator 8 [Sesamum calycinum]|uniref:Cell number regulator 8 n=1 Tax=Sesamum calycinum TaxID=2727403 RepID=A0AAW2NWC2_9LAMI